MIQASVFFCLRLSPLIKEKIDSFYLLIHSASCSTQGEEREEKKTRRLIILSLRVMMKWIDSFTF